jgi:hypothetical protein
MPNRDELAEMWDHHIASFLDGGSVVAPELVGWFRSCRGSGRTAVSTDCFPEPYIGDISRSVRAIVLGLNPGRPHPQLQGREGAYADAIRAAGGYRQWAAGWPYLGRAWTDVMGGPNTFHKRRYDWVKRWIGEPLRPSSSHLVIELYPWHSINLPQPFHPDADAINRYLWEPLADLGPIPVFAFGSSALFDVLPQLPGVDIATRLPAPGETAADYAFSAPTREVMIGRVPTGGLLYIANHSGSDNPPPLSEVHIHRQLARRYVGP